MQYTKAKENGRVAVGYAHAQHTNAHTHKVAIATWDALGRLHMSEHPYRTYTHAQFARIIADKHAKGYVLISIVRYSSGTVDLTFDVKESADRFHNYLHIGRVHMWNKAGRCMTVYAPVQEARE